MKNEINVEVINNYIKENKLTKNKFCKTCKISLSTLNKILNNKENFRIIALFKIAKVLNIKFCEIFK